MNNNDKKIELYNSIVIETLKSLKTIPYSNNARRLCLLTPVVESQCFKYKRQNVKNFNIKKHGISYTNMEFPTFMDQYNNWLKYRPEMLEEVLSFSKYDNFGIEMFKEMVDNLPLQIVLMRVRYLRVKESLPNNVYGCAKYWKKYYNTYKGKGTVEHFLELVAYYFDKKLKNKKGE